MRMCKVSFELGSIVNKLCIQSVVYKVVVVTPLLCNKSVSHIFPGQIVRC